MRWSYNQGMQAELNELNSDAWQAAIDYGIDISQLEYLLTLTPTERFRLHARALAAVRALRAAGVEYYGFDPGIAETPERAGS
jgi:hypothetical protein